MEEENKQEEKTVTFRLQKELLKSERDELKAKKRLRFLVIVCCLAFLLMGAIIGYLYKDITVVDKNTIENSESAINEIKDYFNSQWLYKNNYDDLDRELIDKALYGMTSFDEDAYTTYMSKEENDSFASSINLNYVGIGVQYSYVGEIATVTRVFKDSPAEKAGILVGDVIKKVEGNDINGLSTEEIREKILGEEGTKVNVTINRQGEEKEVEIIRGAVDSSVYAYLKNDIVVLKLISFGENTANECIHYLDDYKEYKNLIIDIRDNGGGYQTAVQEVAGLFLGPNKKVMSQVFADGNSEDYMTINKKYYDNFENIVIMINGGTASAAEVFTMCLRELNTNVKVIGTKSYGKGVVQGNYLLQNGGTLKITTSYWLSPNGTNIDKQGITPDIEVRLHDVIYENIITMPDNETYELDDVSTLIAYCQKVFDYLGYEVNRTDGYFDESFKNALNKYKLDHNLNEDGILDKNTYEAIISSLYYEYNNNEAKDYQMLKALQLLGE